MHFKTLQKTQSNHIIKPPYVIDSLHEAEAVTAYDHITLNFERHGVSSLQIVVQKEVLDCMSLY